jgi:hypothetical protein
MSAAKVNINEADLSFSISNLLKGIICVQGITKRGPLKGANNTVRTWPQFQELYGGLISNSDFPLHAKILLEGGCQLRVNRVVHYDDITAEETLTAVKSTITPWTKLTFSAALVAGNTYNVSINGVAITEIPFSINNLTTLNNIVRALQNHVAVAGAVLDTSLGLGDTTRSIYIMPIANTNPLTLTASVVTGGASQATTTITTISNMGIFDSLGQKLFDLPIKYHGSDYNNLVVQIETASNNNPAYFNLTVLHSLEPKYTQTWKNLTITGKPTLEDANYLSQIKDEAKFVDVIYYDLSSLAGTQLRPCNGVYKFRNGSNGDAVAVTDYTGDSATGTGWHAFDGVEDSMTMCAPELSDVVLHIGGSAYADSRKNLQYFAHLSNTLTTANALIAAREATGINSSYTALYAGGLKITDPQSGQEKNISELSKVIVNMTVSDNQFGEWRSFAGLQRGIITGVLGVVNNFGGAGKAADLDALANAQINVVMGKINQTIIWGNFTAQIAESKFSQLSVRRFITKVKIELKPMLERYLEEPNEPVTWSSIYKEIEPYFNDYQSVSKRALNKWRWDGDQDVASVDDIIINSSIDVNKGKYKVSCYLDVINAIREIELGIFLTPSGVSFTE